jgi:hypothetical protein
MTEMEKQERSIRLAALEAAISSRDADALWKVLADIEEEPSSVPLLARLLLEDWHESHEDIVFSLGLVGDPYAVDAINKAVTIPFPHMIEWGNLHEFQRKCAYALAKIGSADSRTALEILATHSDPYLRKFGQEGLDNWLPKHRRD